VQWWVQVPNSAMAVDNQLCLDMDLSSVPSDIFLIQWREKQGEIERGDGTNGTPSSVYEGTGNGLREIFIDVTPYTPLFQQFLTRVPNLALPQAKKVQIDLIGVLFDSKRQAPFHYPVAAGDYSWDASDAAMFSSTIPAIQNLNAKVNEISTALNAKVPALNNQDFALQNQDSSICNQVGSGVANPGNVLTTQVNVNIRDPGNSIRIELTNVIQVVIAQLIAEINSSVVNIANSNIDFERAVLALTPISFVSDSVGNITSITVAAPGLQASQLTKLIALITAAGSQGTAFGSANANFVAPTIGGGVLGAGVSWPMIAPVVSSTQQWVPIGGTTPVNVTPAEQAAIMQGIANRTNDLTVKKNTKTNQVNALTTIPAVIAYDVTTGW
jgi:hypothetical protein